MVTLMWVEDSLMWRLRVHRDRIETGRKLGEGRIVDLVEIRKGQALNDSHADANRILELDASGG